MDGAADDLKRRFLDRVEAAKRATKIDADLGKALWWMLVTDPWFINQLERYAIAVVGKWRGNEEDAKDLSQDFVLALHEEMLENPTLGVDVQRAWNSFPSWICTIVYNRCANLAEARFARSLPVEPGAETERIAARAWDLDWAIDVHCLLTQLPEPERTAATLRSQEITMQEIADRMQLTRRQVRRMVNRARQRLRRMLNDR